MTFFFISKVLPFRDLRISLSFKGRISFLKKPLLTSLLRFSIYVSLQMLLFRFFFSRLCMRSHPDLHTPSHARSQAHTTHPSILSHNMRHAQPDSGPRPTVGGEDGALSWGVSLEEMNLAPQHWVQTFIHKWVHSHTCLIAWPIGGGALRGWRPL